MSRVEASELRGASVEEAFELVSGVVEGITEAYPDLGMVERYRLMADSLPERIERDLQQRLLTTVHRGRGQKRQQAEYAFLMLNLKTVLSATEEYFNGDPERDADIVAVGMAGLVERLPTLDPQSYPLTSYVYAAVESEVVQYLDQSEGMRPTLVMLGVSGEVEREVDRLVTRYPWGVRPQRRAQFAQGLVDGLAGTERSSGKQAVRAYIQRRFDELPADPEGHVADAEAEVYGLLMQEDVRAAIVSLPEIEQETLRLRYWERLTLEEVGERLGMTRERVRGIEAMALRRLRNPFMSRGQLVRLEDL